MARDGGKPFLAILERKLRMYEILNRIDSPMDVKQLSSDELHRLADEVREALFYRLTKYGGHFGPNFGTVELEIALHYVFDSPKDKIVFDVSHQSYTHKMLTGRRLGYIDEKHFAEDSGYTNPEESEHDLFNIGHTSTSVSLATGLAKARDLMGEKENVIAIIGDGALSGGEAFEGLNYACSELNSNLIVVVNDNDQSIAEVHGGLYKNLKELRASKGTKENNYFKSLGFEYYFEENGNDIDAMIALFQKVKDIQHPVVLHVVTKKGKGYSLAEEKKEEWHWTPPFDRNTGVPTVSFGEGESYSDIISAYVLERAKKDPDFVVVTPSMPGAIGLNQEHRKQLGKQYVDCGIAEEQSIAMASGIARRGGRPLVFTGMSFMQRAFDQISHDVCINRAPVTILLNFATVYGANDITHLGIFGISAFSNIPNLVILAPTSKRECLAMLDWSIEQTEHPVLILVPGNGVVEDERTPDSDYCSINKFKVEKKGDQVAILALGGFYQMGEKIAERINTECGFQPTLINPRFASGIDKGLLEALKEKHSYIVTLEDGTLEGGFGEKVASFYGTSDVKVKNYGLEKNFYDRYDPEELLKSQGISVDRIVEEIKMLRGI